MGVRPNNIDALDVLRMGTDMPREIGVAGQLAASLAVRRLSVVDTSLRASGQILRRLARLAPAPVRVLAAFLFPRPSAALRIVAQ